MQRNMIYVTIPVFNDQAIIEVSADNGVTWIQLTSAEYKGIAPFGNIGNKFTS